MAVLAAFTILCGILYPLAVTGISQLLFHDKANGSIIEVDGVKYGCELLGQEFTGKEYMWGRIMSTNTETFTDEKRKCHDIRRSLQQITGKPGL